MSTYRWKLINGSYTVAANWTIDELLNATASVPPTISDTVLVGTALNSPFTITVSGNAFAGTLDGSGGFGGEIIAIQPSATLLIAGSVIVPNAAITLNGGGATLSFTTALGKLSGVNSKITMSDDASNSVIGEVASSALNIDNSTAVVSGAGRISHLSLANGGTINATGNNALIIGNSDGSAMNLTNTGVLSSDAGSGGLTIGTGVVFVNAGLNLIEAIGTGHSVTINTGNVDNLASSILWANGGLITLWDAVDATGPSVRISGGGTFNLQHQASLVNGVTFAPQNSSGFDNNSKKGTLVLHQAFSSTIASFTVGDTVDLRYHAFNGGDQASFSGTTLTIVPAGGGGNITLNFSNGFPRQHFTLADDGAGGTLVRLGEPTRADLNGNGTSDLVLQAGGTVVDWIMQNGAFQSGNVVTSGASGFHIVGKADFNNDGTADLLLQSGGTVVDWIMQNGTFQSGNVITTGATGFTVVGTGDLDGDGDGDILLQNGGTVVDWIMQNGTFQAGNVITTGASGYTVVGTGDLDADGDADVVLQNGGTVVDWIMQNGSYQKGNVITAGATGFTVVGTGDFNGDGTADILLQNGGTVVDWIMQNGIFQSGNVITTGATGFNVVSTGDYNGDGTTDIALQSGGTVVDWIMKNGVFQTGNVITTGASGFTVVSGVLVSPKVG